MLFNVISCIVCLYCTRVCVRVCVLACRVCASISHLFVTPATIETPPPTWRMCYASQCSFVFFRTRQTVSSGCSRSMHDVYDPSFWFGCINSGGRVAMYYALGHVEGKMRFMLLLRNSLLNCHGQSVLNSSKS